MVCLKFQVGGLVDVASGSLDRNLVLLLLIHAVSEPNQRKKGVVCTTPSSRDVASQDK